MEEIKNKGDELLGVDEKAIEEATKLVTNGEAAPVNDEIPAADVMQ